MIAPLLSSLLLVAPGAALTSLAFAAPTRHPGAILLLDGRQVIVTGTTLADPWDEHGEALAAIVDDVRPVAGR